MDQNEWDAMVKKYKASQTNTVPEGMDEAKLQKRIKGREKTRRYESRAMGRYG